MIKIKSDKKILFVIPYLAKGGAEKILSNITIHFPGEWEIDILVNDDQVIDYPFKGNIITLGVTEKPKLNSVLFQFRVFLKRIRKLRKLKKEGKTIVIITHDLEEMLELCDTISVLRDGHLITTKPCEEMDTDEVKRLMVGREVSSEYYRSDMEANYQKEVVLEVKHLTVPKEVEDVSFELHKGEILGFCGLSDSGIHEVGKAVYGISKNRTGTVTLHGEASVEIKNISAATSNGMAYVPKDRDGEALMMRDSIASNFVLPSLGELQGKGIFLSPKKINKMAREGAEEFQVKCSGIRQKMEGLSGGNKQKVNLGRWLLKDLNVIVLDCPTRGVDVSVKAYIYHVMSEAKKKGLSMILISDELPEVLGMSDRLLIMKDGKVQGEFTRGNRFTQEALIEVMV